MEKSYAQLAQIGPLAGAVDTAIDSLRLHSSRSVICSQCENDDKNRFKVTGIDSNTRAITDVKCNRCKETSYVCHDFLCHLRTNPTPSGLQCSYKEKLRAGAIQMKRKSLHMCSILESTVTAVRHSSNGERFCSCGSDQPHQIAVISVDRLGFITEVQCSNCRQNLNFSPLLESYVVQKLYRRQPGQVAADVIQQARNGDYKVYVDELCERLRRHSCYENSVCPEYEDNDPECCRVVAINEDGFASEVEFVTQDYNANLKITCRADCYYTKHSPNARSHYEQSYKQEVIRRLQGRNLPQKAILSCTVLAATAAILRRHNINNTLCQNCKNDDHEHLTVVATERGFITRVKCTSHESGTRCRDASEPFEQRIVCHRSPYYYEAIVGGKTSAAKKLERGDHVCWHRERLVPYWHHGIVTGCHTDDETITVAEYGTHGGGFMSTFDETVIKCKDMSPSCSSGIPYRITYEDSYTNEYTALRAERTVGEKEYHIFSRNCEHSSYWCKTDRLESDQVITLRRSLWKTFLAFGLRFLSVLLLMAFQMIHEAREGNQKNPEAFERFERWQIGVYMFVVAILFLAWSLYSECKKLKPVTDEPANAKKCCCNRPVGVACGLSLRIVIRELIAAVIPLVIIFLEDDIMSSILSPGRQRWKKPVAIGLTVLILLVSLLSYGIGAMVGTVVEHLVRKGIHCCKSSGAHQEQMNNDLEDRRPPRENQEIDDMGNERAAPDAAPNANLPENIDV